MKRLWHTIWPTLAWVGGVGTYLAFWAVLVARFFDVAFPVFLILHVIVWVVWPWWGDICKAYRFRWNNYRP